MTKPRLTLDDPAAFLGWLAWALKVPVYVLGAAPAVRAQLEFVEAYSLGG